MPITLDTQSMFVPAAFQSSGCSEKTLAMGLKCRMQNGLGDIA